MKKQLEKIRLGKFNYVVLEQKNNRFKLVCCTTGTTKYISRYEYNLATTKIHTMVRPVVRKKTGESYNYIKSKTTRR